MAHGETRAAVTGTHNANGSVTTTSGRYTTTDRGGYGQRSSQGAVTNGNFINGDVGRSTEGSAITANGGADIVKSISGSRGNGTASTLHSTAVTRTQTGNTRSATNQYTKGVSGSHSVVYIDSQRREIACSH